MGSNPQIQHPTFFATPHINGAVQLYELHQKPGANFIEAAAARRSILVSSVSAPLPPKVSGGVVAAIP